MTEYELADGIDRVVRRWAGDALVSPTETGGQFMSEDGSRYEFWLPGKKYPCFEDSGRPCGYSKVEGDVIVVRCWSDAPDAFWGVKFVGGEWKRYDYSNGWVTL